LVANQRFPIFVKDSNLAAAYEKTPFAPVAVVEPALAWRQVAVARGADHELVSLSDIELSSADPRVHKLD